MGLRFSGASRKGWPQTEVIIATGHGDEEDQHKCMAMGAYAFLSKPVQIKELIRLLQEAWNARSRRAKG